MVFDTALSKAFKLYIYIQNKKNYKSHQFVIAFKLFNHALFNLTTCIDI